MNNDQIMVSVCCLVYNHEKYLRQCLDGFVAQKTNFKFEVLIHDDASTDSSPEIIREYEEKYPDMIKPIYQTENQYSKGVKIGWVYQYPRAQGKYIALCEGDDYWTDEYKLQKQFDALEKNPEAVFCAHRVICVTEDGKKLDESIISEPDQSCVLSSEELLHLLIEEAAYIFHTTSLFWKSDITKKICNNLPRFIQDAPVGDVPLMIFLSSQGECVFLDEAMSCYRLNSMGSWSNRVRKNDYANLCRGRIVMWSRINDYFENKYDRSIKANISHCEYLSFLWSNDYRNALQKKYRVWFNKLSTKERIYIFTAAKLPIVIKVYNQWRHRNAT